MRGMPDDLRRPRPSRLRSAGAGRRPLRHTASALRARHILEVDRGAQATDPAVAPASNGATPLDPPGGPVVAARPLD